MRFPKGKIETSDSPILAMIFVLPKVSSFRRTLPAFFAVLAFFACSICSLFSAPLLIVTEAGARAVFKESGTNATSVVELGRADADGILLVAEAPTTSGILLFTHPDAVAPLEFAFVPGETPGKISPQLKLKPASLLISALPVEEVEIFVNGEHKGRGAVSLGGITPREKITVEARSARRGVQSRVVSASPGEMLSVKFDLRGNEVSARPDGQIVLPELPLVLASQPGATVRADGAVVEFDNGVLRGLEPGERVIEIFLPWRERSVCVWRAAMPARSAILPGADVVAAPNPVAPPSESQSAPAAESVESPAPSGSVAFVIGNRATVSLGAEAGLKDGQPASVFFGDAKEPVRVEVSGVTPKQAILTLPQGSPMPKSGETCRLSK